jgi:hypothetical protein
LGPPVDDDLGPAEDQPLEVTSLALSNDKHYLAAGMVRANDNRAYVVLYHVKACGARTKIQTKIDLFEE